MVSGKEARTLELNAIVALADLAAFLVSLWSYDQDRNTGMTIHGQICLIWIETT